MDADAEVIVIGAGVAGLAAAGQLGRKGLRVLLIEARERVGGRVWSHVPLRATIPAVELGAEFVHGGNAAVRALLRAARLRTQAIETPMRWWRDGRLVEVPDFWESIARITAAVPKGFRGSFGDFLASPLAAQRFSAEERERAGRFAGSFNAAPLDELSARVMREVRGGAEDTDHRVLGPYAAIVGRLRARLPAARVRVLLGHPVRQIRHRRGAVEVSAGPGAEAAPKIYRARAAIIALPLGVLKARAINFVPELPRTQVLIDGLGWGNVVRLTLRFRAGFWRRRLLPAQLRAGEGTNFGYVNVPGLPLPTWWALDAPAPLLTGWAGGEAAEPLAHLSADALRDAALTSLARLSGTPIEAWRRQLLEVFTHDWRSDPYSLGAYSFAAAGREKTPERLAQPVADTLFFAGEATSEALGTVHGALASGLRAANQILARSAVAPGFRR